MTKNEIQQFEDLKTKLSLRFTDKVNTDIFPNEDYKVITNGYTYNSYTRQISKSCTIKIYHAVGYWDRTTSQNSIELYSSELLSYKAMRNELELQFASILRSVDKKIEELEASNETK